MAYYDVLEIVAAFSEVIIDLKAHPERRKHSVVTMSLSGPVFDPENPAMILLSAVIQKVMDMDVPVVVSAGNTMPGHPNIDTVPAVFAGTDYPIIVVGSAKKTGDKSSFTPNGPQITIHAVGEDASCLQDKDDPATNKLGVSFGVSSNISSQPLQRPD